MLIKGITQLNGIITEEERLAMIKTIMASILNDESKDSHYGNSVGNQINIDYSSVTNKIKEITGLDILPQVAYARIYKDGSTLKPHKDREGLDLTLSIQLSNTFGKYIPIYGEGYDGCVYRSDLNDRDSVLIKGRELNHWRNDIKGDGELICIFLHWKIVGVEKLEIENFLSDKICDEILTEHTHMVESMVLYEGKATVVDSIRSNKVGMYNGLHSAYINERIKQLCGELKLEGLQLLKYDIGKKFSPHLDQMYNVYQRLFTVIIYLNDDYEGGNTNFTNIGYKVIPKKGKLLIWKNINKDAQGNWVDNKNTMHESLPVITGTKYSLVQWCLI